LTRRLLALRAAEPALHASERPVCEAEAIGDDTLAFVREDEGRRLLVVARLRGSGAVSPRALGGGGWTRVVDTEDPAFAGDPRPIRVDGGTVEFARPGAIVLSR
jgi:Tfp pilus assembly protein PilX